MDQEIASLSFEQAYEQLERTVQQLEEGDLTLDEAIALYEQGMQLAQRCGAVLDAAELQIQQVAVAGTQQVGMFFEE